MRGRRLKEFIERSSAEGVGYVAFYVAAFFVRLSVPRGYGGRHSYRNAVSGRRRK